MKAKVFTTGRSQAVRIPKEFRFNTNEVAIRRDEATGDVILSSRSEFTWKQFFAELNELPEDQLDFLANRNINERDEKAVF